MFKSIKNNKGFTLIELLAVIVIMGVLMMVAIPQVTKYIENSKKDAYAETSKAYINAVRYALLNDELTESLPESGKSTTVSLDKVKVESGGEQSPYGKTIQKADSCVKITASGTDTDNSVEYIYEISIIDEGGAGTGKSTKEKDLKRGAFVKSGAKKCGEQ